MSLIVLLLLVFALAAIPALAAASIVPPSRPRLRYGLTVGLFALFVTPSWGAATIVSVPMPFGVVLLLGAVSLDFAGVAETILVRPLWHLVAFPLTTLLGALLFRRVRPNNSFKPKPLRGSA